ncbi:MAG: hypothetical protein NC914_02600 [Candidatus Omnitrophica bacterium]|nr:hypothetical protein [Candidatus Omnitrophota bacterium]
MKLKKYTGLILLVIFFGSCVQAAAAPCYGTYMPAKRKITLGLEYNFVISREFEHNHGRVKNQDQFLTLSFGVFDWLSIDLKGGAGKITYKDSEFGDQEFSTSFAGAYGFRLRLYENKQKRLRLVGGFQHISVHPRHTNTPSGKYSAVADEWQGSILGSVGIKKFTPYFGVKYGAYDLIRWINSGNRKRYKSEDNFGLVVGMDLAIAKNLRLNTEFDFLAGQSASVSLNLDF